MTIEELEQQKPESVGTLTVTHLAIVQDEETGQISRIPLTLHLGSHSVNPDFHLGAVSD
jgi:hypothetical protein